MGSRGRLARSGDREAGSAVARGCADLGRRGVVAAGAALAGARACVADAEDRQDEPDSQQQDGGEGEFVGPCHGACMGRLARAATRASGPPGCGVDPARLRKRGSLPRHFGRTQAMGRSGVAHGRISRHRRGAERPEHQARARPPRGVARRRSRRHRGTGRDRGMSLGTCHDSEGSWGADASPRSDRGRSLVNESSGGASAGCAGNRAPGLARERGAEFRAAAAPLLRRRRSATRSDLCVGLAASFADVWRGRRRRSVARVCAFRCQPLRPAHTPDSGAPPAFADAWTPPPKLDTLAEWTIAVTLLP